MRRLDPKLERELGEALVRLATHTRYGGRLLKRSLEEYREACRRAGYEPVPWRNFLGRER